MATNKDPHHTSALYRSQSNRVIAGVCGGLGEFFNIDPSIIRILFVLGTLFGGSGLLIYIVLWIVIPTHNQTSNNPKDHIKENVEEIRQTAQNFASDLRVHRDHNSKQWIGIIILVLGLIFLLENLGFLSYINFGQLWPLFLIIIGFLLLFRR